MNQQPSDKQSYPHINFAHKLAKYEEYNLNQCFFGEYLVTQFPDKPIAIAESEKTAMLCAGVNSNFVWLASGKLNNLNAKKYIR